MYCFCCHVAIFNTYISARLHIGDNTHGMNCIKRPGTRSAASYFFQKKTIVLMWGSLVAIGFVNCILFDNKGDMHNTNYIRVRNMAFISNQICLSLHNLTRWYFSSKTNKMWNSMKNWRGAAINILLRFENQTSFYMLYAPWHSTICKLCVCH